MAIGDLYRMEIHQNVGSEPTMNVIHAREVSAETLETFPALCLVEMAAELYTAIAPQLSEDWQVIQISARRVAGGLGVPVTKVFGGAEAIVGAVVSEIVPSTSAILISTYGISGHASARGRMYLPGCPESHQKEGQLSEAEVVALDGILNGIAGALTSTKGPFLGGDGQWNFSHWSPGNPLPLPGRDVKLAVVRPNLATQRRRRAHPGFAS